MDEIKEKIALGALFIYPTDTIYSIGCDATNPTSVKKIREIKEKPDGGFSVIPPHKQWIYDNCVIDDQAKDHIENNLPSTDTLRLTLANKNAVCKEATSGEEVINVRIPKSWIRGIVRQVDKPIVITAVNKLGRVPMTNVEDLDPEIKSRVDLIIEEGSIKGMPSKLIHLEAKP